MLKQPSEQEAIPKEGAMPEEDTENTPVAMPKKEVSPEAQREAEMYCAALSHLMHSKETSGNVLEMLKSGDPQEVVPQAALTINNQMEEATRKKGKPPSLDTLGAAATFIVGDLLEIGNAAGIFQIESKEEVAPILRKTMQSYIEKGIHDGTIDPIELQKKVEPMMDDEHRALGLKAASMSGIPLEPNQNTAMQAYGAQQKRAGMLKGGK